MNEEKKPQPEATEPGAEGEPTPEGTPEDQCLHCYLVTAVEAYGEHMKELKGLPATAPTMVLAHEIAEACARMMADFIAGLPDELKNQVVGEFMATLGPAVYAREQQAAREGVHNIHGIEHIVRPAQKRESMN